MGTAASTFGERGFEIFPGVLDQAECDQLSALVPDTASAGSRRMLSETWCNALATTLARNSRLSELLPQRAVAVQCTYFSKSASSNWLVSPHQDLSIPVANRGDFPVADHTCLVPRGGVLAIRPLLVHASSRLDSSVPRRVLHFLYGPPELPHGLRWADAA